jgi:hypothetical protein
MKFDDLLKVSEGFDSLQTQDSQTGNSNQIDKGLSPALYRSTGASEGEENEKPGSIEKNKLVAVIDELKVYVRAGMTGGQVENIIGKLSDVHRSID